MFLSLSLVFPLSPSLRVISPPLYKKKTLGHRRASRHIYIYIYIVCVAEWPFAAAIFANIFRLLPNFKEKMAKRDVANHSPSLFGPGQSK